MTGECELVKSEWRLVWTVWFELRFEENSGRVDSRLIAQNTRSLPKRIVLSVLHLGGGYPRGHRSGVE